MTSSPAVSAGGRFARRRANTLWPFGLAPALILVAVNFMDGVETNIVAGVLPFLQDEWGFSDTWAGAIPAAAAVAGVSVVLVAGYLADHHTRTRVLAVTVAVWAVLTTVSALAVAFWMFFLVRVALGAANSIDNPAASSLLADYYPPVSRGRVFSYQRVAYSIGTGAGIALGGGIGELLGWRAAFLVLVVPALVVALLCWFLWEPLRGQFDHVRSLDSPASSGDGRSTAGMAERLVEMEMEADGPSRVTSVRGYLREVRRVLAIRSVRYIYVGIAVTFLGFNGIAFWMPSFFKRAYGLGEGAAGGLTGGVILVVALAGSIVGGVLGDRALAHRVDGRIVLIVRRLLLGACITALSFAVPVLAIQMVVLAIGAFVLVQVVPNLAAAISEVLPAERRGTGFSVFFFMTIIGQSLGPLLIGGVSELTGSLRLALGVALLPAIPGALVVARSRHSLEGDVSAALDTNRSKGANADE